MTRSILLCLILLPHVFVALCDNKYQGIARNLLVSGW